ncbi:hypothetical protein ACFV3R_25180 [Streptomyces sp. NPDC059740]|uniref:hypothetical protein n=1 Tax=Streptomyces sp. NPDC059740 TaxID=3346926 RepID=UPI003656BD6C
MTFQSGAWLLMDLGIVQHITHQGIRYIANHHPAWPFGPGRRHQYWELAGATVMATEPFIAFFEEHPHTDPGPQASRVSR